MANAFLVENTKDDISSNIFSITFRKFFGEFTKGRIPPVIAKKDPPVKDSEDDSKNKKVVKVILPTPEEIKENTKIVEKRIKEFEENIEIVLKENPTKKEVEKVYSNLSNQDEAIDNQQLTLNDVYNNLAANCYGIQQNLSSLVKYYNKIQLYQILDKCEQLDDPKIHLIADRLHQIQLDERDTIDRLYSKYLRILSYVPLITFVAFIVLFYEFVRRYIINYFRHKNTI